MDLKPLNGYVLCKELEKAETSSFIINEETGEISEMEVIASEGIKTGEKILVPTRFIKRFKDFCFVMQTQVICIL